MQFCCALAVLTVTLSCLGVATGEVLGFKTVDGKQVACMHTGMVSPLNDCTANSDSYTYVFVGSISKITPIENDEFEVQTVPEEVFSGKPHNPMTVVTSQGLCLPKFVVGDRWLFYLRKEEGKPIVLDYYGNDSLPVADAQEQIATLRRLERIGRFGILRGQVVRGEFGQGKPVLNASVTAKRHSYGTGTIAITDADGRYEFQPLPPGGYKITVAPIGSYRPDDSEVDQRPGSCWDLTLFRSPQAQIGGHVRRSDRSPVSNVDVVLIESDNSGFITTQTDRNGHFLFGSQEPGEFVLGLNFPKRPDWFNGAGGGKDVKIPPASMFYPGVAKRSGARVIRLKTDEKLNDLDFTLPTQ